NDNTATGYDALQLNTTGASNTALGSTTLQANTSGSGNVAVGLSALTSNVSGNSNVAVGEFALFSALGTNNIAIGDSAGSALGADFDNIDIGNSGTAGDSGTIRIGDPVVHMGGTFISGIDGATVDMATGVPVVVDAFGRLGTTVSSGRFKEDVR